MTHQPVLVRRIVGESMLPTLKPGQIVIAIHTEKLKPGDVVFFSHNGLEKVKRIKRVDADRLYLLGENSDQSTDSRHFGWVDRHNVLGRVIWPRIQRQR